MASSPRRAATATTCREILADDARVGDAASRNSPSQTGWTGIWSTRENRSPFQGIEREVVVAELEVGRIEVAEVFELVVEARAPSAVRAGEAHRLESRAAEDPVGPLQVDPIGLGLAVDVMEMPVRLRVVVPQVLAGPTGDGHRHAC